MKLLFILISVIGLIGFVTSQVIIKDSQEENLGTVTINQYIQYQDTPESYGTVGQCAGVNSQAFGMDWINCLSTQINLFDQNLNTTDNVTFHNISAKDITGNCIEEEGFFEWTAQGGVRTFTTSPPGAVSYEGNVNFVGDSLIDTLRMRGLIIPYNLTVTRWYYHANLGQCISDAVLEMLRVNASATQTGNMSNSNSVAYMVAPTGPSINSFKFNESLVNIPFNKSQQIILTWFQGANCVLPPPIDPIITIVYVRRCD